MSSRQSSPQLKGKKWLDLWGAVVISYCSQSSECSLSVFPAGGNGMDSVTKKTRQDGSEVTERRKENIFNFCYTSEIPEADVQFFKALKADQRSRTKFCTCPWSLC